MKGYRSSPYNATDYDNLTEAEKEALARKFRAEDEANTQRDKSLKPKTMTYIYYRSTTSTTEPKISETQINEWKHLADKKNWRITQLANGYYQTEVNSPNDEEKWVDVTRRETLEGAEAAVESSVEHFSKKIEYIKGPKVVKTFK